jgi:hypothetical protein
MRLRRWVWRTMHVELEVLLLMIIVGIGILIGLWWGMQFI